MKRAIVVVEEEEEEEEEDKEDKEDIKIIWFNSIKGLEIFLNLKSF